MKTSGWRVVLSASVVPMVVACAAPQATSRSEGPTAIGPGFDSALGEGRAGLQ
ncbi:MAG: hypothetical protein ACREVF_07565 [Burkholderiales bacterium]